jgi:hypothetical protein
MKTFVPILRFVVATVLAALYPGLRIVAQTFPTLEFATGAGNPGGTVNGPSVANQVITFQKNTNNPTGTTLAAHTPTLTATFSISNQQYTLPAAEMPTLGGLAFGAGASETSIDPDGDDVFATMSSISTPANTHFTSSTAVATGTGIAIASNKAIAVFTSSRGLYNNNLPTDGRYYFGDVTVTFNQNLTNPILHLVGMGGRYHNADGDTLYFTTELELQTPGVVLSKLSGSPELAITDGTKILNSSAKPSSPTGAGAASGSVLASGSGIISLTFRVYMRGNGGLPTWMSPDMHLGDTWLIGFSLNAPINLLGNVYRDANGLVDNLVNGTGIATADGTQLYANLLTSGGVALNSVPVTASGAYSFANVPSSTNYLVQVSSAQPAGGLTAPAPTLPAGWVHTGEILGTGTGSDGTPNGQLALSVAITDITNANFGIEKTPVSAPKYYYIDKPAANSTLVLNGTGTAPGPFSGSDLEDGTMGAAKKVAITSLPASGDQLWYNGTQITRGADNVNPPSPSNPFIIASYTPNLLSVRFTGGGVMYTSFNYAFYDAADLRGVTATYIIDWFGALPLKFLSFSAIKMEKVAALEWSVAGEESLHHYVIEKSTDGGVRFTDAGRTPAKNGSRSERVLYHFEDQLPANAAIKLLYRIRAVDARGKTSLSDTRMIKIDGDQEGESLTVVTYPNPVSSEVKVKLPIHWQGQTVELSLINKAGQTVIQQKSIVGSGTEILLVDKLAAGVYVVRARCEGKVLQSIIIKQ